ncbi:hypothetical protein B0H63DRAFT_535885, partial [Podospora didyma]
RSLSQPYIYSNNVRPLTLLFVLARTTTKSYCPFSPSLYRQLKEDNTIVSAHNKRYDGQLSIKQQLRSLFVKSRPAAQTTTAAFTTHYPGGSSSEARSSYNSPKTSHTILPPVTIMYSSSNDNAASGPKKPVGFKRKYVKAPRSLWESQHDAEADIRSQIEFAQPAAAEEPANWVEEVEEELLATQRQEESVIPASYYQGWGAGTCYSNPALTRKILKLPPLKPWHYVSPELIPDHTSAEYHEIMKRHARFQQAFAHIRAMEASPELKSRLSQDELKDVYLVRTNQLFKDLPVVCNYNMEKAVSYHVKDRQFQPWEMHNGKHY